MTRLRGGLRIGGLLALAALTAACGARAASERPYESDDRLPGGKVITQEDIARTRAQDAWEAIERSNTHLVIERARGNNPSRISYRGVDSLVSARDILLVVNGNVVKNVEEELRSIRAESILFIQILTGSEASVRWGSESGNGVILIRTTAR